ncbi:MAG: hypothetical protein ACREUW_11620 [Burkholderiales bacterium]
MLFLKLALVPALILLVSLAARRWGHRVSGWLSAVPIIAGPILFFMTFDLGVDFTVDTARGTLIAMPALAAYLLVFGLIARRAGWAACLFGGWAVFALVAVPLTTVSMHAWQGLLVACAAFIVTLFLVPRPRTAPTTAAIPNSEIVLRMAAAFALTLIIAFGAQTFGPRISGALLSFPIGGSVLPAFTRALHGTDATLSLLRGFLLGLLPFAVFFYALAMLLPLLGIAGGFIGAMAAVLAAHFVLIAALHVRQYFTN